MDVRKPASRQRLSWQWLSVRRLREPLAAILLTGLLCSNGSLPSAIVQVNAHEAVSPLAGVSAPIPTVLRSLDIHGTIQWGFVAGPSGQLLLRAQTRENSIVLARPGHRFASPCLVEAPQQVSLSVRMALSMWPPRQVRSPPIAMPSRHLVWSINLGHPAVGNPVLLANHTLNVLTTDGMAHSLFLADGTVRLVFAVTADGVTNGLQTDPQHTVLYVLTNTETLRAISENGQSIWTLELPTNVDIRLGGTVTGSVPQVLSNGALLVNLAQDDSVIMVSPQGRVAWAANKVSNETLPLLTPTMRPDGSWLVGQSGEATTNGELALLDRSGALTWASTDPPMNKLSSPAVVDSHGYIYAGTADGVLASVFAKDGSLRWRLPLRLSRSRGSRCCLTIHPCRHTDPNLCSGGAEHLLSADADPAHPSSSTMLRWTWHVDWKDASDRLLGIIYHYVGKNPVGDQQVQAGATAQAMTATGQCGQTYYLRIRALGPGFPATYYAPADGILADCPVATPQGGPISAGAGTSTPVPVVRHGSPRFVAVSDPSDVAVDYAGNLYIADAEPQ